MEELIQKYLEGKCTSSEKKELKDYFNSNPEKINTFFSEKEWDSFTKNTDQLPVSLSKKGDMLRNIESRIQKDYRKRKNNTKYFFTILFVLGTIGLGTLWFNTNRYHYKETIAADHIIKVKNTTDGEYAVTLPDQSSVQLQPGSEIIYDSVFTVRKIELIGKAYFSVQKNTESPFTVLCNNLSTTVLGTEFIVDGRSNSTRVDLYKGKVSVKINNDDDLVILNPGQFVEYKKSTEKLLVGYIPKTEKSDSSNAIVKKSVETLPSKISVSKQTTLTDFINTLTVKYDVEIDYPISVTDKIDTDLRFSKKDSVEVVLQKIAEQYGLEYTKTGKGKYILK